MSCTGLSGDDRASIVPVGGEFAIERRPGPEKDHDSAGAKHGDQARLEQGMMRRRVGLAWYRRASGARDARCNSP